MSSHFLVAVLLTACGPERAERPAGMVGSASASSLRMMAEPGAAALTDSVRPYRSEQVGSVKHRYTPVESVTVKVPTPLPVMTTGGIPFGPFDLFQDNTPLVPGFTGAVIYTKPSGIIQLLAGMKANKVRGFLKMTGDPHADNDRDGTTDAYRTNGKFDLAKWKDSTDNYFTPAIKAAIDTAVEEGTLLGFSLQDEPTHYTWGGVMTKPLLDEMCRFSKSYFPTLPCAVVASYKWRPAEHYKVVDVLIPGTWKETISPAAWISAASEAAKLNGLALAPVLNLFAGRLVPGCETWTSGTSCTLTPAEIRSWGAALGGAPNVCGLFLWKYTSKPNEPNIYARPEYQQAFRDIGAMLAARPTRACKRSI
jgi:hypothetical protein